MSVFSEKQLQDYKAYEEIRLGGQFNMFDPRAAEAAGLTKDEFLFVMSNYSAIRLVYEHKFGKVEI